MKCVFTWILGCVLDHFDIDIVYCFVYVREIERKRGRDDNLWHSIHDNNCWLDDFLCIYIDIGVFSKMKHWWWRHDMMKMMKCSWELWWRWWCIFILIYIVMKWKIRYSFIKWFFCVQLNERSGKLFLLRSVKNICPLHKSHKIQ